MVKGYTVLRDTQEKEFKGWWFEESDLCLGTREIKLPTADYTLAGYEEVFLIERKGCISEFVTNLNEPRFEDELCRLDKIRHPYLVLEFEMTDVMLFPVTSSIPKKLWPILKMNPKQILRKIMELQVKHRTRLIFAGSYGKEFAASLFKRIFENVRVNNGT